MNRKNIWIHVTIAVVLITLAALVGQIERWKSALRGPSGQPTVAKKSYPVSSTATIEGTPEVLVRFKPGVTLNRIKEIASANHDRLTDQIESVSGLTAIDDLDDANAQQVADQYSTMTDTVAYAEVNRFIKLDDPTFTQRFTDNPSLRNFKSITKSLRIKSLVWQFPRSRRCASGEQSRQQKDEPCRFDHVQHVLLL